MVMLVTLFSAMTIPVKAQVSDWKEYTVVCKEFSTYVDQRKLFGSGLLDEINEMINHGWQPLGGLVIHQDYTGTILACQTMVKD